MAMCHVMPLFGVFDWSIIIAFLIIDFQTRKFSGIWFGILPLFSVKLMIFLDKFPY